MPGPQVSHWRAFTGRRRAGHVRPLPGGFPASLACRTRPGRHVCRPYIVGDPYMRPVAVRVTANLHGSSGTPTPTVGADSISARCRSRHRQPPQEGFSPPLRTFQKHTYLFYSIPANSARISALISSTERMDFAPFASAAVHSMRCQPSVRAQYSAAARLRARYSVSFS